MKSGSLQNDFFSICQKSGVQSKILFSIKTRPPSGSIGTRVSIENSLDSKQPKLEQKLVSALSETKLLFRLFRFYTKTASFGVSIEPKQAEDQPKQTETNRYEAEWAKNWIRQDKIRCIFFLSLCTIHWFTNCVN